MRTRTNLRPLGLLGIGLLLFPGLAQACTTFCFPAGDGWIFGSNLDWMVADGHVVTNRCDVAKTSYAESNPAQWVSRYGSVTFNMYGRELPMCGMNEAGLVIDNMWLEGTTYAPPDERPAVHELQWIQYQLDTAASVAAVLASDTRIRIEAQDSSPLHFLICDATGDCAAIEFIGGQRIVARGQDLPYAALTNSPYREARRFLEDCAGREDHDRFADASYSLKRFAWAAQGAGAYDPDASGAPVDYAFQLLERVSVERTQWSIAFDLGARRIHFRTRSQPQIRCFDLAAFDFACDAPVRLLPMNSQMAGEVSGEFRGYSYEANFSLIRATYRDTPFLKDTPLEMLEWIARYPDQMRCVKE